MPYSTAQKDYTSFSTSTDLFDDKDFAKGDPIRVEIRHSEVINAIRFVYKDENLQHGGTGGDLDSFEFAENEYLIKIELNNGIWFNSYETVLGITFTTNLGHTYSYGNCSEFTKTYYYNYKPITALVGKTIHISEQQNEYVADLGVYYIDRFSSNL